jgi:hypothetical protein
MPYFAHLDHQFWISLDHDLGFYGYGRCFLKASIIGTVLQVFATKNYRETTYINPYTVKFGEADLGLNMAWRM